MDDVFLLFFVGFRVCLFIYDPMIHQGTQAESGSRVLKDRHWVVLQSEIDRSGGIVEMTIYTWGDGHYKVPKSGVLSLDGFLMNYYGYVAGKPLRDEGSAPVFPLL